MKLGIMIIKQEKKTINYITKGLFVSSRKNYFLH